MRLLILSRWKCRRNNIFSRSSGPIPSRPVVPPSFRGRFGLRKEFSLIDSSRMAVFDHDLSVDNDGFDIGAAAVFDQRIDWIARRSVARRAQVDDHHVGFPADGQ